MQSISIVSPVYNEGQVIASFYQRIAQTIEPLADHYSFEIILVDDGSRDQSLTEMRKIARLDPRLRIIQLQRNYGQTAALQAGLDSARGEIVITMDADLQHFPEEIPIFLDKLNQGYDLVCGWRKDRAEGILRRWPSRTANRFIHNIAQVDIHDFGTTYRAYRAEFTKDLRMYGEFHRFLPVLIAHMGGRICEVPIQNIERPVGKSNYGIGRTFGVFLDLLLLNFLVHYLDRPLRIFGKIASIPFIGGSLILAVLIVYAYISGIQTVLQHIGWFMISILLLLTSVQITLTGILAEIVVRVFYAQGDQRVYRVAKEWSIKNSNP